MLSALFVSAARVRAVQAGPAGALLDSFAQALSQAGYASITVRRHVRAAEHFAWRTDRTGVAVHALTQELVDRFGRHVPRCRCPGFGRSDRTLLHSIRLFLRHLEDTGTIRVAPAASVVSEPPLVGAFRRWMGQQRGTCEKTLDNYAAHIRPLLARLGQDAATLDARSLREFVLEGHRTCGWAAAKKRTTALRTFVRFLIADGRCESGLMGAIPVLAHWRLASLPRYLPEEDVERVLASCDTTSPVGTRDRAILVLLARLGLRAGDIVQLRLSDLDWAGAWIRVCGKGRREARLPLTHEVGQALVTYLVHGRPQTDTDAVFVRSRPPFRAFRSHCAVSVIVAGAFRRAGVRRPSRGAAHLLRHSIATAMLRHGASLQEVAAVLRHRSIATTQIYAKVDVAALRQIAQPWPEGSSC
jgi:site-specific recombinase XerD